MDRDPADLFDLQRFVEAQNAVYQSVLAELSAGRKRSHWMWFIFPQISGLGSSGMSRKFAICSLEEAKAFLDHPVLGHRLREVTELVIATKARSVHQIFGSPDDMKFHSSMTLFARVYADDDMFSRALQKFFDGKPDAATLAKL